MISVFYIINTTKACKLNLNYKSSDKERLEQIYDNIYLLNAIFIASCSVLAIVMGLMMAYRLRYPFFGLYTDYGLKLVLAIITQILTLLTSTILNALDEYNEAWNAFFFANETREIIYIVIYGLFVYILPMMS